MRTERSPFPLVQAWLWQSAEVPFIGLFISQASRLFRFSRMIKRVRRCKSRDKSVSSVGACGEAEDGARSRSPSAIKQKLERKVMGLRADSHQGRVTAEVWLRGGADLIQLQNHCSSNRL
ncbi:hypothetical protein C0J45_11686 [Silurus meridionalis]|uniref:Uncharacterized protein n=1 Tax=Silurus meridionalis TaxID=175797 RepID=A0A8T0B0B0_SILME|nr:hypothetical protein HF521_003576 [Silurus meridionalis]KAI5097959.1 hypothetical protein C0J45_11686 [Silurus meridionalis]